MNVTTSVATPGTKIQSASNNRGGGIGLASSTGETSLIMTSTTSAAAPAMVAGSISNNQAGGIEVAVSTGGTSVTMSSIRSASAPATLTGSVSNDQAGGIGLASSTGGTSVTMSSTPSTAVLAAMTGSASNNQNGGIGATISVSGTAVALTSTTLIATPATMTGFASNNPAGGIGVASSTSRTSVTMSSAVPAMMTGCTSNNRAGGTGVYTNTGGVSMTLTSTTSTAPAATMTGSALNNQNGGIGATSSVGGTSVALTSTTLIATPARMTGFASNNPAGGIGVASSTSRTSVTMSSAVPAMMTGCTSNNRAGGTGVYSNTGGASMTLTSTTSTAPAATMTGSASNNQNGGIGATSSVGGTSVALTSTTLIATPATMTGFASNNPAGGIGVASSTSRTSVTMSSAVPGTMTGCTSNNRAGGTGVYSNTGGASMTLTSTTSTAPAATTAGFTPNKLPGGIGVASSIRGTGGAFAASSGGGSSGGSGGGGSNNGGGSGSGGSSSSSSGGGTSFGAIGSGSTSSSGASGASGTSVAVSSGGGVVSSGSCDTSFGVIGSSSASTPSSIGASGASGTSVAANRGGGSGGSSGGGNSGGSGCGSSSSTGISGASGSGSSVTAVSSAASGGGGSITAASSTSSGSGSSITAVSSAASGGGGSITAASSAASGSGSSITAVSSAASGGGGSITAASSASSGSGSSITAVSSAASGGGGSITAASSAASGSGSSITAVSSAASGGGGSITAASSASSGSGSSITAVSSAASGGGGSITAASSAASGSGSSITAVSSAASGGCGSSAGSGGTSASGGSIAGSSGGPSVSLTCMISQNEINWYRVGSLLYNGILPAMLSALHNDNKDSYIGLPRDPTALFNELMKVKPKIDKLAGKPNGPKIINKDQMKLIYPSSKTTDSSQFDITLTVVLIRNLLNLPKPQARWDKPPKANDSSITANILRGQQLRNFFAHNKPDTINTPTLDTQFTIGERILNDLNYTKCDTKMLKTEILDRRTYAMIMSFAQKEKDRLDDVEKRVDTTEQKINSLVNRAQVTQLKVKSVEFELDDITEKVDLVDERVENNKKRLDLIESQEHVGMKQIEAVIDERLRVARSQETGEIRGQIDELYWVSGKNKGGIDELNQLPSTGTEKTGRIGKLEDDSTKLTTNKKCQKTDDETGRKHMSNDNITFVNLNIADDGTSHFHFIKNTNWSIWTHHSKDSNPSEILHSFERSTFIPSEINCQLYECGYTRHYKEHEMDEHHLRKFRNLFCEDMKNQPWLLTNLYVDCVENLEFHEFSEKLQKWCAHKEHSFLLLNYSCEEHLRMLNANVDEVKYSLQNSKLEIASEQLLAYIAKDGILMNIRFVPSSDSDLEPKTVIEQAVSQGQNDVKLFTCLHMGVLEDCNITLVSITVLNNMVRNDVPESICRICSNTLIITQDEWLKENVLQRKLDRVIAQKRKISVESKVSSSTSSVANYFERVSSRLWGWLCTKDVYLPNLSIHGASCLARIYLNAEQLRFMHLKQRHLMLKGPYGSGKSIMGMTKFRQLALKATSLTRLYFICCSSNTMYTALMKSRLHEMLEEYLSEDQLIVLNLDEYAKLFDKPKPLMLSNVLQDIAERHYGHLSELGVIFDEYDASNLTEQEACSIDMALLDLKDSHVIIMCQSMEITRKKVTKSFYGIKKNKTLYDAFMFGSTNMQIETFHLTMRNCTRVNELSRVATQVIENATNEFFERGTIDCEDSEYTNDSVAFDNLDVRYKEVVNTPHKATNNEAIGEKLEPVKSRKSEEAKVRETSVAHNEDCQSENRGKNSPDRQEEENLIVSGLFDHFIKNVGNLSQTYTGVRIKSTFKFPGKWMNGHSVEGDIPQLIYPFGNDDISYDNVNSFKNKVRMRFALQSVIDIPTHLGNIGIICFDPIDAQLFHNVLISMDLPVKFYTPILFPTQAAEVVPDLRECAQTHIIITDHVGAQGLELNQLIVSIDPNEKYVHQYLVEALTRCINTLYVMLISKRTTEVKEQGGVCKKIVENWIRKNLIEVSKVTICEVHEKDDIQHPVCEEQKTKGKTTYQVHHWHEDFESCSDIQNCEKIPLDVQRVAQMSRTITNTHHVKEMIKRRNCKSFAHVASVMMDNDLDVFRNMYKKSELRQIHGSSGETLLDVARKKFLMDYALWLKSIGVPGLPVRFQCHRGLPNSVTVDKDNMVEFMVGYSSTVAAPQGAISRGEKVMFEVTFHGETSNCYIGWVTPDYRYQEEDVGYAGHIGACAYGYSFHPYFGQTCHNNSFTSWGIAVDEKTTKVLGVAADLQSGTLWYAWDGNWKHKKMGVAFKDLPQDIVLYPAISSRLYRNQKLEVNFGDHKFKFKPPDKSFRGINDLIQ